MPPFSDASPEERSQQEALLILDLQKQHISVNYENPTITMGRDAKNRIVVDHPKVSRIHARIELHKNGFILSDQSTNGTHVFPSGGEAFLLKKEKWTMEGDGIIYLGKAQTPDALNAIHFHIL